jgi:hypothetical protein
MRSPCSVSGYISPLIVARQWLCKHVPAATSTHAKIEELVDASFLCGALTVFFLVKRTLTFISNGKTREAVEEHGQHSRSGLLHLLKCFPLRTDVSVQQAESPYVLSTRRVSSLLRTMHNGVCILNMYKEFSILHGCSLGSGTCSTMQLHFVYWQSRNRIDQSI